MNKEDDILSENSNQQITKPNMNSKILENLPELGNKE